VCKLSSAGSPSLDFFKAMRAEHMSLGGCDYTFVTGNYKLKTQACTEWLYVAGDGTGERMQPPASEMGHGRIIHSIDDLMQKPLSKMAKLTREEMVAIVMYTGPAFVIYNAVLRRFPAEMYKVFKDANNLFSTTIFVLVSAVNKLSRCMNIPPGTLLYRGLGGTLEFPDSFTRGDTTCTTPNALGFLEFGFMSTSADKSVAVQYSGVKEGKPKAGILQIRPNTVDRGADISEFSQYPAEKEYLFVPYSFVQGEGRQRTEVADGGGVLTVVPVRVNINLKSETVEELKEKKKRLHLASARAIVGEVKHELEEWAVHAQAALQLQRTSTREQEAASKLASFIVDHCQNIVKMHADKSVEHYVDDDAFRKLVNEILDTKSWAKEKKRSWMQELLWDGAVNGHLESMTALLSIGCDANLCNDGNNGNSPIYMAAQNGHATCIKELFSCSGDVHKCNRDGESPIYIAARNGHADCITLLVSLGGNVNTCANNDISPIFTAACRGHAACITALVTLGGDINRCNSHGASPIFIAAQEGHSSCISELIRLKSDINKCDENGVHPIFTAAKNGLPDCIALLASAGGDVNKCNDEGVSPICIAAKEGHASCISQLVSFGAVLNNYSEYACAVDEALVKMTASQKDFRELRTFSKPPHGVLDVLGAVLAILGENDHSYQCAKKWMSDINLFISQLTNIKHAIDRGSMNAEHIDKARPYLALEHVTVDIMARKSPAAAYLCAFASNIVHYYDRVTKSSGASPIYVAAQNGHAACIQELVIAGGDVEVCNKDGVSPLQIATRKGHATCITKLVSLRGDVSKCNNFNQSLIFIAAENGHEACISELQSLGCDPRKCDIDGSSSIYIAAYNGHSTCITMLASMNCDVNVCNSHGASPIRIAASNGCTACVKELISLCSDVNKCDNDGASPVYKAAQKGNPDCIALLACAGSDVNKCNDEGVSPICIAAKEGHDSCIKELLTCLADPGIICNGFSALDHARQKGHTECVTLLESALK
jgi:ankyrin repeat protein